MLETRTDHIVREPARITPPTLGVRPSISVVIPTLNEAKNLPHVLAALPPEVSEVVIVDGHSTDGTVAVAKAVRPDAKIVLQDGIGKGNALCRGFEAVTGDITIMLDADGSTDPSEIPRFVAALKKGSDLVKGSRFLPEGGSEDITGIRTLGNRVLVAIVNMLWGTQYSDLCYGYIGFWTRCVRHLDIDCDGFEVETVMNIRAAQVRLRVAEVPSVEVERLHGVSNLRVIRDGWRIAKAIMREFFAPTDREIANAPVLTQVTP